MESGNKKQDVSSSVPMTIGIYRPFDLAQDDMFLETIDYRLHERSR